MIGTVWIWARLWRRSQAEESDIVNTPRRTPRITLLLSLALLAPLAGCALGAPSASHPTATLPPAPTPTPRTLYQADWSSDASQWTVPAGWRITASGLANSGDSNTPITIPYTPQGSSYSVQFVMQIHKVVGASACNNVYGLKGLASSGDAVFTAGVNCVDSQYHGSAEVFSTASTGNFDTYDYTPGTSSRTYTVAVDGEYVSFFLNDSFLGTVQCVAPTAPVRLTFYSSGLDMEIQRVTITTP